MNRVAVLGSGLSGLATAWLLSREHEVTLFEKENRVGGPAHALAGSTEPVAVDAGFMLHHAIAHPHLDRLLSELGVETAPSELSFAVSGTALPWCSRGLNGLFFERRHLGSPAFYRLGREVLRFGREAPDLLREAGAGALSLGGWLRRQGYSQSFQQNYLLPLAGALWQTPPAEMGVFPALSLVRFFERHGLLGLPARYPWRTVRGGVSSCLPKLTAPFRDRIVLGARIVSLRRTEYGVYVHLEGQDKLLFDDVVLALPGDQILPLLADPSAAERQTFSAFASAHTPAILHRDASLLPRHRRAWASLNIRAHADPARLVLTTHLNRVRPWIGTEDLFLTLHGADLVDPGKVIAHFDCAHPRHTVDTLRAQGRWEEVSGPRGVQGRTHYAGAHWGDGFHEDELNAAIRVAECFGIRWLG